MFSPSLDERKRVAKEVGKACRDVGFFYALRHDVPEEVIQKTFHSISDFFSQPHHVKMETHINKSDHFRGYEPTLETKLDPTSRGGKCVFSQCQVLVGVFSAVIDPSLTRIE